MKRLAVLCIPAAAAAVAVVVLLPGAGSAQQAGGEQTFKLVEPGKGAAFKFVDIPPRAKRNRPSSGDGFVFTTPLNDASGARVGTLAAQCTFTPLNKSICNGIFHLKDGTITGTTELSDSLTTHIAITGGTGAYEGARGTITSVDRSHADNAPADDTVHLLG